MRWNIRSPLFHHEVTKTRRHEEASPRRFGDLSLTPSLCLCVTIPAFLLLLRRFVITADFTDGADKMLPYPRPSASSAVKTKVCGEAASCLRDSNPPRLSA